MNNLLIDTNVLIYSTNKDSKYYNQTVEFFKKPNINSIQPQRILSNTYQL